MFLFFLRFCWKCLEAIPVTNHFQKKTTITSFEMEDKGTVLRPLLGELILKSVEVEHAANFKTARSAFAAFYKVTLTIHDETENVAENEISLEFKQLTDLAISSSLDHLSAGIREQNTQLETIQGYGDDNFISKSLDCICTIIEKLELEKTRQARGLDSLRRFIEALHNYDLQSIRRICYISKGFYPDIPITLWKAINGHKNYPGELVFADCCQERSPEISLSFWKGVKLVHSVSSDRLLQILENSSDWKMTIDALRGQANSMRNLTPQGLIFCSLDLCEYWPHINNRYAEENRYGAFQLHFTQDKGSLHQRKLFWLGTKSYSKEYSQQLLISERKEDFWWVYNLGMGKRLEPEERSLDDIKWELRYCSTQPTSSDSEQCETEAPSSEKRLKLSPCLKSCWTHPELVFPKQLDFPFYTLNIKVAEKHSCIRSLRTCLDCEGNGDTRTEALLNFSKGLVDKNLFHKLMEIQNKFTVFSPEDFESIMNICDSYSS